MSKMAMKRAATITQSGGNIFADLGLPDAEDTLRKAELIRLIGLSLDARGLTQSAAARRAAIAQPDMSRLLRGQSDGFSYERLLRILAALGNDVEVRITAAADPTHAGTLRVMAEVA